jgi:hypothetical protein
MELTWTKPNQYNTHSGSETFIATRGDNLYTIFSMFNRAELTVVTSKNVVYKRTNLRTAEACRAVAESI